MRLDEAVLLCLGRLTSRQRGEGQRGEGQPAAARYSEDASGKRTYAINDLASLKQFLGTGRI